MAIVLERGVTGQDLGQDRVAGLEAVQIPELIEPVDGDHHRGDRVDPGSNGSRWPEVPHAGDVLVPGGAVQRTVFDGSENVHVAITIRISILPPDQAGDVVGHSTIAVVGVACRRTAVLGVLPVEGSVFRRGGDLAGVVEELCLVRVDDHVRVVRNHAVIVGDVDRGVDHLDDRVVHEHARNHNGRPRAQRGYFFIVRQGGIGNYLYILQTYCHNLEKAIYLK